MSLREEEKLLHLKKKKTKELKVGIFLEECCGAPMVSDSDLKWQKWVPQDQSHC